RPAAEIQTLSLHDALPISARGFTAQPRPGAATTGSQPVRQCGFERPAGAAAGSARATAASLSAVPDLVRGRRARRPFQLPLVPRSEEHTSELQSPYDLVCL